MDSQSINSSQTSEDLEDAIVLMEVNAAIKDMPDLVDFDFKFFDDDSDLEKSEDVLKFILVVRTTKINFNIKEAKDPMDHGSNPTVVVKSNVIILQVIIH